MLEIWRRGRNTLTLTAVEHVKIRVGFLAGGIGGSAKGFASAKGEFKLGDMPVTWEYEIAGSLDIDEAANREFDRLMGIPGLARTVDLFDRPSYIAFHSKTKVIHDDKALIARLSEALMSCVHPDGLITLNDGSRYWRFDGVWAQVFEWCPPPPEWREVTPHDLVTWFGAELDVVFASTPCQGNSRLKSEAEANELPSRALNKLTSRVFYLVSLAPFSKPVKIMFNENVPGIKHRSAEILADMDKAAKGLHYATQHGDHDTGKACGGPQSRPRHFWTQRHIRECPPFLYQPIEQPLASIMSYLKDKPMPGDPRGGAMHDLPKLGFETWLRLALIKPGGDWKDIPGPGQWQLRTFDGRIVPPEAFCMSAVDAHGNPKLDKNGKQKIRWFWPDPEVWGKVFVAELLPGAKHYCDVRLRHSPMGNGRGAYWVQDGGQPSGAITADPSTRKSGGASTVADGRLQADISCPEKADRHASHLRVIGADSPAGAITGATHLANGAPSTSDLRLSFRENRHSTKYEVADSGRPSDVITTSDRLGSGAPSVADIRFEFREKRHSCQFKVQDGDSPAQTVTTQTDVQTGAPITADARLGFECRDKAYSVGDPDRESPAITGNTSVTSSNGPRAIADPRFGRSRYDGSMQVMHPDRPTTPIIGATSVSTSNGPGAVADPRIIRNAKGGTMSVQNGDEAANTVTTATDTNGDAQSLADARMTCKSRNGTLGVIAWNGPSPAIIASLDVYCGQAAVEDVRVNIHWWPDWFPQGFIISPWNAWHRPLTDWELWILQTFPAYDAQGQPYALDGTRKQRRKFIGNAVMPLAARAYAHALAPTIIVAKLAPDAFLMSPTGGRIWVDSLRPELREPARAWLAQVKRTGVRYRPVLVEPPGERQENEVA